MAQRAFFLRLREVATEHAPSRPTLLMYGVEPVAKANPAWEVYRWDGRAEIYKQKDGRFFVAGLISEPGVLTDLAAEGIEVVAYEGSLSGLDASLRREVTVVDDLEAFFGRPLGRTRQ